MFKVQTDDAAPTYGTFSITDAGEWIYKLDNTDTTVQALGAGDTLTDTVTVTSFDGTATKDLTITINGTNDVPQLISSASEQLGVVTEDGTVTATGDLDITDIDGVAEAVYTAQTDTVISKDGKDYGKFSIAADGKWTFTLDNASSPVQELGASDQVSLTVPVATGDGTTQNIAITVKEPMTARKSPVAVTASEDR